MPKGIRFNREQYARDFKRSHHASEQYSYKVFKKALDAQKSPVIAYIDNYGMPSADLIDVLVSVAPMQAGYRKVYETVGLKFARLTYYWVRNAALGKKAAAVDFYSEKWRRLLIQFFENDSVDRVTEVTETTKEQIRKLLAQAVELDMTTTEQAFYMLKELNRPDFNKQRALRIARTETTTAANKGALIGGADSDYETGKAWLSIKDRNTRASHLAMNSENVIGYDEQFIVGGEEMAYPGDVKASAKEVIQCRCALLVVPLVNANGLPILKNL